MSFSGSLLLFLKNRIGSFLPACLAGERGISLIEMLVTISVAGLLAALALPNFNRSDLKLADAMENLIGNIRLARANAISRGARYRVTLDSTSYAIQRLQDPDGDNVWEPDGAAQEFELPSGISISEGAGQEIEFTTRGLMAPLPDGSPPVIVTIRLSSPTGSESETIDIWPSGQVQRV
jgi:prepilin-type N-terminal cleavage/methylation domain-containing protein